MHGEGAQRFEALRELGLLGGGSKYGFLSPAARSLPAVAQGVTGCAVVKVSMLL